MRDILRFFQLPTDKIAEFIFLLEGEDGIGVVRTLDPDRGIIEVLIAQDFENDFNFFLKSISGEVEIREIEKPEGLKSVADDDF